MRFDVPPSPDSGKDALVGKLADRAKALAKTYAWPHGVYKALDELGIKDAGERKAYFSKVAAELKRRKRIARLSEDASGSEAAKYETEERERENREE